MAYALPYNRPSSNTVAKVEGNNEFAQWLNVREESKAQETFEAKSKTCVVDEATCEHEL